MKTCSCCREEKAIDAFHRRRASKDGRSYRCKDCDRRNKRSWERRNPTKRQAKEVRWRRRHPDRSRAKEVRDRQREDPHKTAARKALNHAVEEGELHKPDRCQQCGTVVESRFLHGHHEDYDKPLEVEWLCSGCHGLRHREEST